MPNLLSRRYLLSLAPFSLLAADALPPTFPTHTQEAAAEVVGLSHSNLQRIKELVTARPSLAKASYDWGFGDWETALGAASHVGNRDIALFLLDHGAPATIFSAAMLGQLDVVKAFVAAQPGIHLVPGPHGISLLNHARTPEMKQFLESLGPVPAPPTIPEAEKALLSGIYTFGPGPTEKITLANSKGNFQLLREGRTPLRLFLVNGRDFHPAGAPAVRIRITESPTEFLLQILDPEIVLTARRPKP